MPVSSVPTPLRSLPADTLLGDLLAVSMTGVIYYTPLYDPAGSGDIVDFRFEYLNPTAQRMMRMPEVPTLTHNEQWPHSKAHGTFAFHVDAFVSGEPREYNINYQADGYDNYYRLAARRSGDGLWVSFTDTADQPRSPVEVALREAQAREQAAHAEAETQRAQLHHMFEQAPAMICIFEGPQHVFQFVNPPYQALVGERPLVGRTIAEAMPELAGQPIFGLLDRVYQTGETFEAHEMLVQLDHQNVGASELEKRYYNFIYQARRDLKGTIDGILVFAYEVTPQVVARQQLEQLNQELEARVQERTQAALVAQAEALRTAQQQVQQREALFHILADTPAAVALLRGPEHRFEYVNTAYQQLFPERQLTGRAVAEALPETEEAGFLTLLDEVYRTGETFFGTELPMHLAPAGGHTSQQVYYTFTYQAYRENGQVAGVSIFAFDVTEQVQSRQQGEAERQQLHTLFMEAPAPIVILSGPNLVFQLVNPAYQRIFPGRALLGRPVLDALPEIADAPIYHHLREVYDTGTTFVAQELPLQLARHDDGPLEDMYWTFTYQARRTTEGAIDGVLVFAHEVTDQVRARQVVERNEQYLRQMADNVPTMIWLTDAAGQCVYLNQQWYDYTGQTEAEGLGVGWLDAVHPDDRAATHATFADAAARQAPFSLLYRQRRHDGRYRWAVDTGLPRFHRSGQFEGYVGTVFDIHEQKQGEQALQHLTTKLRMARDRAEELNADLQASNEQLTRTNVDLDNFIYTASHDLKAPISNIEGLLNLLQEELPAHLAQSAQVAPTLLRMMDSVERFKRTIDHLTEVTKLQKEHDAPVTAVNLAAVVEDVHQDLLPLMQATGAKLVIDVSGQPPVRFSEKNLRSVVYNLLSNALKYHSPDRPPRVDVRAHVRLDHTVLEVHDNGLGIESAYLPRLFSMFQRFHTHVEGSGIGLYMVKRMVENAGGHIDVHSQPGAGTTFFVHLPQAVETA
ncbi:PAS domain-containing protein [Hymenobacter sublimis]|uniref:histidine kinase n=1 Tax=Hymenobacter sublimis TaxID=2933777 RepID=A0ABY4JE49_9BACT|nr:PAS domain-containing protein [Hymenobacter sublimis]UPL50238.1 PAS domain-containing protein [Hymenobacter sublimis]